MEDHVRRIGKDEECEPLEKLHLECQRHSGHLAVCRSLSVKSRCVENGHIMHRYVLVDILVVMRT